MNCRITQATPPIQYATSYAYAFPWYRVTHIPIQSFEGCIRFDTQPSSVSTPEGLGRLETLQKRNKLGSNLIVAFQEPPSVFHLISIFFSELLTIYMLTCFALFHHAPMIALWKRSELKRVTQQIRHMKLLRIPVSSWIILPVPPYHHHKMHITFSFESRKHLRRTYKAPALLGSTARQKSKNTWDTSEVAVATPINHNSLTCIQMQSNAYIIQAPQLRVLPSELHTPCSPPAPEHSQWVTSSTYCRCFTNITPSPPAMSQPPACPKRVKIRISQKSKNLGAKKGTSLIF